MAPRRLQGRIQPRGPGPAQDEFRLTGRLLLCHYYVTQSNLLSATRRRCYADSHSISELSELYHHIVSWGTELAHLGQVAIKVFVAGSIRVYSDVETTWTGGPPDDWEDSCQRELRGWPARTNRAYRDLLQSDRRTDATAGISTPCRKAARAGGRNPSRSVFNV